MSAGILCVGALALDTIFRLDALPTTAGKYLPTDAFEVVQAMATAQAATIAKLGGKARLWASCGDDAVGDRMVRELGEASIDARAVRRVPGARSGFSTILMDRHGERIIVPQYDPAIRRLRIGSSGKTGAGQIHHIGDRDPPNGWCARALSVNRPGLGPGVRPRHGDLHDVDGGSARSIERC